jgi:hypothetical protein
MPEYRFYPVQKDGHIAGPSARHDEPDDRAAVSKARQTLDDHDIEIWEGPRIVAYVVPDEKK